MQSIEHLGLIKKVKYSRMKQFQVDNPEVRRLIDLRDYLITHPEDADIYSELKERLVIEHSGNRDSYVDGKHDFIQELNRRAREWKESIEW